MMFLHRIVRNAVSRLFPGYAAQRARKEKAEVRSLGRQLFPEETVRTVFPHLKARRHTESGKWTVRANRRTDAYLLLNALHGTDRAVTKYLPDRIRTTVRINRRASLTLTEYLFPTRTRPCPGEKEETLFAQAVIRSGDCTTGLLDFYIATGR